MQSLFVSHWLVGVTTLGPGRRIVLYFTGCSKHCKGCEAPSLQNKETGKAYDAVELADILNQIGKENNIHSISITGGDPLEQDKEAFELFLKHLNFDDVLLFTGYTLDEIHDNSFESIVNTYVSVLKTGPYIEILNKGHPLMGSSNQLITYIDLSKKEEYENYISKSKRKLQYFYSESGETLYFAGLLPKMREE